MSAHFKYPPAWKHRTKGPPIDLVTSRFTALGMYRKFVARNESCVFRAVADTRYLSQSYFTFVQRDLVNFVDSLTPEVFTRLSHQTAKEKDAYLQTLRDPALYKPSLIDLCLLSTLYAYSFRLYEDPDAPPLEISSAHPTETILLYTDFHMICDLLYTTERYKRLAFCQHIVYEIYYQGVFQLEDIYFAVQKMLANDLSPAKLVPGDGGMDADGFLPTASVHKEMTPLNKIYAKRFEMRARCPNMRHLLEMGITPFPFKVAKALHPDIYRNIEFDVWVETKRGCRGGLEIWTNIKLTEGVTCEVTLPGQQPSRCIIQHVDRDQQEASIFLYRSEGQVSGPPRMTVPLLWLSPSPEDQVLVSPRRYVYGKWEDQRTAPSVQILRRHSSRNLKREASEESLRANKHLSSSSKGDRGTASCREDDSFVAKTQPDEENTSVMDHAPDTNGDDSVKESQGYSQEQTYSPRLMPTPLVSYPLPPPPHPQFYSDMPHVMDWDPAHYHVPQTYENQPVDYNCCNAQSLEYTYHTPPPCYPYEEAPPPGYVYTAPPELPYSLLPPPYLHHGSYSPEVTYSTPPLFYTGLPAPPVQYSELPAPPLHYSEFVPQVQYTELVPPVPFNQDVPVFPFYPEQAVATLMTYPVDSSMAPLDSTAPCHDVRYADSFLEEVDSYLVPPPGYTFCPPGDMVLTLSPPTSPDLLYYYPHLIHQAV